MCKMALLSLSETKSGHNDDAIRPGWVWKDAANSLDRARERRILVER